MQLTQYICHVTSLDILPFANIVPFILTGLCKLFPKGLGYLPLSRHFVPLTMDVSSFIFRWMWKEVLGQKWTYSKCARVWRRKYAETGFVSGISNFKVGRKLNFLLERRSFKFAVINWVNNLFDYHLKQYYYYLD